MTPSKVPTNKRIKCPICNYEFIPESFHHEKIHFDLVESKGELMKFQNEKHQVVIKPYSSLKGSWVTYCPECGFMLKFAAEVGKKEVVEEASLIKKLSTFKEFGQQYKYTYTPQNKPYMDYLDYFIEKVDSLKKAIKDALDEVNFFHWGDPYREWKTDKKVDSFKFLVRFFTNLEDYTKTHVEEYINKDMEDKIKELELSEDLENFLQSIRQLRNKIVHEAYEITEEEDKTIEKAFISFMSHLVVKQLKPLNLDNIEIEPEYNFIDINKINYEIQNFLRLYLYSTLRIKDFNEMFLTPLLEDLGITVQN
ncbi:MAG: hypothetical protein ACXAC5_24770 [Promethearchaeota archaeon]|jgi:hypothetical protein